MEKLGVSAWEGGRTSGMDFGFVGGRRLGFFFGEGGEESAGISLG